MSDVIFVLESTKSRQRGWMIAAIVVGFLIVAVPVLLAVMSDLHPWLVTCITLVFIGMLAAALEKMDHFKKLDNKWRMLIGEAYLELVPDGWSGGKLRIAFRNLVSIRLTRNTLGQHGLSFRTGNDDHFVPTRYLDMTEFDILRLIGVRLEKSNLHLHADNPDTQFWSVEKGIPYATEVARPDRIDG